MNGGDVGWSDYIDNGRSVREIFGDEVPDLLELDMLQLVLDAAGGVFVSLHVGTFPKIVPMRWLKKGFDSLQFRMTFVVTDMEIKKAGKIGKVSIVLDRSRLHIAAVDEAISLRANFVYSRIDVYPYRLSEFKDMPAWFARLY